MDRQPGQTRRVTVHRILLIALSVFATASGTGCSLKAWYGGMQFATENQCRRQPPGEVESCLARLNPLSYEDYERRRTGKSP
jgi:hypothetical protein